MQVMVNAGYGLAVRVSGFLVLALKGWTGYMLIWLLA